MDYKNTTQIFGPSHLVLSGSKENDWYIAFSRDDSRCIEGSWQEWIEFARAILAQETV